MAVVLLSVMEKGGGKVQMPQYIKYVKGHQTELTESHHSLVS